ncbi:MAG: CBS domain-containing protein [bacterium]|nr:CBS domain-containing protein [bacterium]
MKPRKIIRVRDVMDDRFLELDGLLTVKEALEAVQAGGSMPIIIKKRHEDDEYGIVVRADITKKVLARDRAPERVNIYEIMSKPVISVRPDMDVRYCARLLERFGISVAPVVENGEIMGIVGFKALALRGLLKLHS